MRSFIDDLACAFKRIFSHKKKKDHKVTNQHEDDPVSQYMPPVVENYVMVIPSEETELCEKESINNMTSETVQSEDSMSESNIEIDIPREVVLTNDKEDDKEIEQKDKDRTLKLFISFSEIINEFDTYILQTDNKETKQIIGLCQYRLIETMVSNGATPIDKDIVFDCLRHVPVPFTIVRDGIPIKEILRTGLEYDGRVVLKAKTSL